MRKDKECFSICAAEDELQGTLRHVDLRDLLAGRRIDEDLAVGADDVVSPLRGGGDTGGISSVDLRGECAAITTHLRSVRKK